MEALVPLLLVLASGLLVLAGLCLAPVLDDWRCGVPVWCALTHRASHDRRRYPEGFASYAEACQCQECGSEWVLHL
jgi:hypothetical protein